MPSMADMIRPQIRAGYVPPSTGPPLYSVVIGVLVSAWPTQTQVVKCSSPPQNQASPLFSVVPVLPHSASSPNWASLPVPSSTLRWRMLFIVEATLGDSTREVLVLFSATVLPFGSVILSIATGARSYGVLF